MGIVAHFAPASAAHRQVFLLGGQSNMVGFGTSSAPVAQPYVAPLPEVRYYYGPPGADQPANLWVDLSPATGGGFGPELSFGNTLHQTDPGSNYALIKHARGGSNVSVDWNPTVENNVYADFRTVVDGALQALTDAGDTYEIVGMLWTQGIRDGKDFRNSTQYQTDLERLIADIRLRYQSDLPVFISRLSINMTSANPIGNPPGGRGNEDVDLGLPAIRLGQENVALNDPLAYLIDTDSFSSDTIHFNSSGLIDLGMAFAESYFTNVAVPEPSSASIVAALVLSFAGGLSLRRRATRQRVS